MKKLFMLLMAVLVVFTTNLSAYAENNDLHPDSPIHNINLDVSDEVSVVDPDANPDEDSSFNVVTELVWTVTSKARTGIGAEPWRIGTTGHGPSTLSINESKSLNRYFTATISGSYPMGAANVGASLGVNIGSAKEYGTSYTLSIPSNQIRTIIFRPLYDTYRVEQTQYQVNYITGYSRPTGNTAVAYVNVFRNWEYGWRNGY